MKKLMYLSISMLCLAITLLIGFHIGSQSAKAQAPEAISGYRVVMEGGSNASHYVMLSNGDVYFRYSDPSAKTWGSQLYLIGNYWQGGPVPASPESWGGIKGKYEER